ncbi:response regulator [Paenibacillus sp. GYB004]|uniref:response regulator transcription factor n=1 Tax=Paenibacillus sp. GYB004 TaxID=2994393 RepID=UPI002F9623BA
MYRVILADDEKWIAESLIGSVDWKEQGFEIVAIASNGAEAMRLIGEMKPDVAFLDIRMPGMTGLEVVRMLRDTGSEVECVMASGYAEFEYAQQALRYGAAGYCLKPFQAEEIAGILSEVKVRIEKGKQLRSHLQEQERPEEAALDLDLAEVRGEETFPRIVQYVKEHFREPISLPDIAGRFYMHPNYVSQLFKKEMNMSFTKFLADIRMEYAGELLRTTSLSVGDIAELSGYNDYFYFARFFKKHTGVTPTEYRNRF